MNTFNLNSPEQFPVLHGLLKHLDSFTPYDKLAPYFSKSYHVEDFINTDAETLKNTDKDINRAIGIIKTSLIRMKIAPETHNYIDKLIKERDYLLATNIPGKDQREFNIEFYNKYVIEIIEKYYNFLEQRLYISFDPFFNDAEREKLGIKKNMDFWFKWFSLSNQTHTKDLSNKNFSFEFIETYKTEVTPERINFLNKMLEQLQTPVEKLKYLNKEKTNYLNNLPAETLAVSGNTFASSPILFDSIIQNKINEIKEAMEIEKIYENNTLAEITINLESIKPKILVLRELGIIELINQKFNSNNSKVAECLGIIINEKPASIRGILSNMNGKTKNNTNPENINSLENAITVLNSLGCTKEVVRLQNKLEELIKVKE